MAHLPTHPRITDPRTGEPLRAIGLTSRGPIWPVAGGSEDPAPAGDPATEPPVTPPAVPAPPVPAPPPAAKDGDTGGRGGKDAVLADLAAVRAKNKVLEDQFARLGQALGVQAEGKGKTDIEALTERVNAQEERAAAAEMRALRAEVAQETKLPSKLAARLTGTSREELLADAADLLALIAAGATPASGAPGETPVEPPKPKTPAPDPTQGAKGSTPSARPTSLNQAVQEALDSKR